MSEGAAEIFQISLKLTRLAAHIDGYPTGLAALSDEDINALTWIQQSLEDVEATMIGLAESNLPLRG